MDDVNIKIEKNYQKSNQNYDDLHFLVIGYQEHQEMQAAGDRKRIFLYNGGWNVLKGIHLAAGTAETPEDVHPPESISAGPLAAAAENTESNLVNSQELF